jgi:hypothetical protein
MRREFLRFALSRNRQAIVSEGGHNRLTDETAREPAKAIEGWRQAGGRAKGRAAIALFMILTTTKMLKATMRKLMQVLRNIP